MLALRLPWTTALLIYIPLVLARSFVGAWLMYSLEVDSVTWRNRAAEFLLPWGRVLGHGPVEKYVLVSTTLSLIEGGAAIAITHYLSMPPTGDRSGTLAAIVGWILLAGSTLFFLRMRLRHAGSPMRSLKLCAKVLVAAFCVAAPSVGFFIAGWPWVSMAISIAPLTVAGISFIPLLFILIICTVSGKPLRWH